MFSHNSALNWLYTDPSSFGELSIYILEMQSFLLKSFQILLEVLAKHKFATGANLDL